MANYNVNMKQWNGSSFDNVLPLAFNSKALEGKSYDDIIQYVQSLFRTGGENCRIAWGSYTGTGTYGAANKITLQTDFTPQCVLITNPAESANLHLLVWLRGMAAGENGYSGHTVTLEWGEHSVAWYSTVSGVNGPEYLHLNVAGKTYQYVILGYWAQTA